MARYDDIPFGEDPLIKNLTTADCELLAVRAPYTRVKVKRNNGRFITLETDIGGLFRHIFKTLEVDDHIYLFEEIDGEFIQFWDERIRE